jgi:hypothetical protein
MRLGANSRESASSEARYGDCLISNIYGKRAGRKKTGKWEKMAELTGVFTVSALKQPLQKTNVTEFCFILLAKYIVCL